MPCRRRLRCAPVALLFLLPLIAEAVADTAAVEPGDRVRIRRPGADPPVLVGTVESLEGAHLVLREADAARVAVPLAAISRLELDRSDAHRDRRGRRAGLAGAALGLVGGGLFGALTVPCDEERQDCHEAFFQGDGARVAGFLLAGVPATFFGWAVGTVWGGVTAGESWEIVPVPQAFVTSRGSRLAVRLLLRRAEAPAR